MDDGELLHGFLNGTLGSFAHREHVRVGYLLLERDGFEGASAVMSERIRAMAAAAGDPDKFHVTRTIAWLRVIDAARMSTRRHPDSEAFLNEAPWLLRSGLLDDYYSPALLRSDAARTTFIEPDLAPLASD